MSKSETADLIERLRAPANWLRQDKGQAWKEAVSQYDRAPFEAADEIERLRSALSSRFWHPISKAPRDGTRVIARRVPEDSRRGFGGVETWWGRASHADGWCHFVDPEASDEVDIWQPDEWRFMIEDLDV